MDLNKNMEYLRKEKNISRVIRSEIIFAPLLVVLPLVVGFVFIYEWYSRGFVAGISSFDFEFVLGLIIIFGNVLFDIPFIRSLIRFSRKGMMKGKK